MVYRLLNILDRTNARVPNTTALTCVVVAAPEVRQVDAEAVELTQGGSPVAGAGESVAVLIVFDALGGLLQETFTFRPFELPALDEGVDGDAHLADGPLLVFFSAAAGKLSRGTSNSR